MKRLVKSSRDKVIAGVCGGVGEYLGIDPVIVRLVMVILFFMGGTGLLAYLVAAFIMPSAESLPEQPQDQGHEASSYPQSQQPRQSGEPNPPHTDVVPLLIGGFLVLLGAFFMTRNIPALNHYYWWLYHHVRPFFWPGLVMGVGLLLILRGSKPSGRS